MKKIVSVSLGPKRLDYEVPVELWGERFAVRRVGTDGDTELARRLVREHDGQVDCIALGGMAISFTVGERTWNHRETLRIARAARSTPVVGGRALKSTVDRWAIRQLARTHAGLFDDANVLVLSGIASWDMADVLREFTESMAFADPVLHYGVPTVLRNVDALRAYTRLAMPFLTRRPYVSFFPKGRAAASVQQRELSRFFHQADVVVGDLQQLLHYAPRDLAHKVVITDSIDDEALEVFRDRGVEVLCTVTPKVLDTGRSELPILHALTLAHLDKDPMAVTEDDYLGLLRQLDVRPRLIYPRGERKRRRKFAYLYYPPGRKDLFRPASLRWLRAMPDEVQAVAERAMARLPVRAEARVRGVVSPLGDEAEGWILYLPTTADQMATRGEAYAARRLKEATRLARSLGAELLGVGAFAREMSEATTEVARRAAIPITAGGSFLISANLWAAKQAVLAMGIPQDEVGRAQGTALVVGAGDPLGAVAAELIALVFSRVVVVDRQPDRLLELVARIGERSPHCTVEVATRVGAHLSDADLVITGVAPGWRGTVELSQLRSGATLCDFSRPSEFELADQEARPDVLMVYSGEIELPGPAEVGGDLGPPPKVVFASLAEVVALALEGRPECFTLGDDVDLDRVKEIYKLAVKHGLTLASMRGPYGDLADTTIRLVRERVEERRRREAMPPPVETAAGTSDDPAGPAS